MVKKYRKKPVEIEAIKYTGDNIKELKDFIGDQLLYYANETESIRYIGIRTLEGTMKVSIGDYIIKGIKNEFYPCKPDIFETTYDRIYNVN